jgi:hypothetical protein
MTAHQNAGTPPDARADWAPLHRGRRRPAVRWIAHGVLFVALAVGIFGLLPRLGGLTRDAAGLRHARPAFLAAAVAAQAVSLGSYAQLYRRVLAALGARIRFRLAADIILATFFVSHLTPLGSATGTLVNASTLETDGVAAATTGEAITLTGHRPGQGHPDQQPARVAGPVRADRTRLCRQLRVRVRRPALRSALARPGVPRAAVPAWLRAAGRGLRGGEHRQRHPADPGGLGVIEVTLVALTVGFGAPRTTAVLAVLGHRIVNYWLPLVPGAIAYLRLRIRSATVGSHEPSTPSAG